ncbi:hypothetical protein [Methylomonas sp. CM2]|uniref:hypothetical protein n=1 Tax=Methylomonas sp. CM2 TaxID=3417647 RepID=UPI003CE6CDCD
MAIVLTQTTGLEFMGGIDLRKEYAAMNEATNYRKSLPLRHAIAEVSKRRYYELFERMKSAKKTPVEYAQSKSYYYTCRAAWCYCLEQEAKAYYDLATKEKDALTKITYIKAYCKLVDYLRECPPDPEHKHLKQAEQGQYTSDWKEAKKPYKKSRSKKSQKLPKGWQDSYFDYLSCLDSKQKEQSDYLPVVCCLKLFGVRPQELVAGVVVRQKDGMLHIIVKSVKTHNGKYGQDVRSFSVSSDCQYYKHLLSLTQKDSDLVIKIGSAKNLSEQLRKFNDRIFPNLSSKVSAYTFRHQFLATAKGLLSKDGVAVVAGHSNDLSQSYYSNRKRSVGGFRIDNINGTRSVKQVAKHNSSYMAENTDSLSIN